MGLEFKNAKLNAFRIDVSTSVLRGGLGSVGYELNWNEERLESLSERFARLEREISQLDTDLQASRETPKVDDYRKCRNGGTAEEGAIGQDIVRARLVTLRGTGVRVDRSLANDLLRSLHTSSTIDLNRAM